MNLYKDLQTWADKENKLVNAIVEIPMGSMVKYEFNKKLNVIEVDRFLKTPMPIPYNY
jgi:inorganic pyrophosphatase